MKKTKIIIFALGVVCFLVGLVGLIVSSLTARFSLDEEEYSSSEFVDIDASSYASLVENKKNFLLLVDQSGCITAEGLKNITSDLMKENGFRVHRIMYGEMRETSLYGEVKYYPSFVIFREGQPIAWLKADADEDTIRYKDKNALLSWLETYINLKK